MRRDRAYRLYCHPHYRRWKRNGDPGPAAVKSLNTGPRVCKFPGCDRPFRTAELCGAHYLQQLHGKALKPLKSRVDASARNDHGCKLCTSCQDWLPADSFYRHPKTSDKLTASCIRCHRDAALRRTYGITLDTYETMLRAQANNCAICGGANADGRNLYVDHDHKTGQVRGLLCNLCNRGIGNFRDNINNLHAAINYLRKHTECP